jgi:hypothetical protein
MMQQKHPDAALVAVDSHFINPFTAIQRIGQTPISSS